MVKNPPASTGNLRDAGSILGLGRSSGQGNGNPCQYSCLENPMDRGDRQATVHRVAKVGHNLVTEQQQSQMEIFKTGFAAAAAAAKSIQSCPTLCDPRDCSPPGSSVPGILQARIPEWVAMPSSRGSSRPRD